MIDGAAANQALAALTDSVVGATASDAAAESAAHPGQALLVLRAGSRWLALPTEALREVALKSFITRIPLAPPQVLGVTLIRGRLLPVISLELLLHSSAADLMVPTLPRLVVIETADAEAAIVADEVHGIVEFSPASLVDQGARGVRPAWVVAEITWEERLLLILHPEQLIAATLGEEESR